MPRRATATILKSGLPDRTTLRDEVRAVLRRADRSKLTHKVLRRLVECRLRLAPRTLDGIKSRVHDLAAILAEEERSLVGTAAGLKKRPREEPNSAIITMRPVDQSTAADSRPKKARKTQQEKFLSWVDMW